MLQPGLACLLACLLACRGLVEGLYPFRGWAQLSGELGLSGTPSGIRELRPPVGTSADDPSQTWHRVRHYWNFTPALAATCLIACFFFFSVGWAPASVLLTCDLRRGAGRHFSRAGAALGTPAVDWQVPFLLSNPAAAAPRAMGFKNHHCRCS